MSSLTMNPCKNTQCNIIHIYIYIYIRRNTVHFVDWMLWNYLSILHGTNSIQGEHKNTPWFQVVIKSKLTGIFLQNWWLQFQKLIQFHVVSHTHTHTHTQCAPLLLLGKHRCDNLTRARLSAAYPAWPTWQLQRCVPAANPRLRVVEVHRLCPSRSPKGKMSQTFRSGDLGGHLQNTWSFCLARPLRCCEVSAILHFTAVWRRVGKLKISWVNVSAIPYL